jgi:hypothetical protein
MIPPRRNSVFWSGGIRISAHALKPGCRGFVSAAQIQAACESQATRVLKVAIRVERSRGVGKMYGATQKLRLFAGYI